MGDRRSRAKIFGKEKGVVEHTTPDRRQVALDTRKSCCDMNNDSGKKVKEKEKRTQRRLQRELLRGGTAKEHIC